MEAAVIKQDCEKALAQVTPYLRESEQALKALKKEDVYLFSLFSISLYSFFYLLFCFLIFVLYLKISFTLLVTKSNP